MRYEYSGYLENILDKPDPDARDSVPYIEFTTQDIARWKHIDDPRDLDWQAISAKTTVEKDYIKFSADFQNIQPIDHLNHDDPSFWAPLGTLNLDDERLPINLKETPIVEVTYRCLSAHARPAWIAHYQGGDYFDGLPHTKEWLTQSRCIRHNGFPDAITSFTLRLYSVNRSEESIAIKSVRFRAMTPHESQAYKQHTIELQSHKKPKTYPLLQDFLPMGVVMLASAARNMAELMQISFRDYWRLALEDILKNHHNCVLLEDVEEFTTIEWREILSLASRFNIRIVPMYNFPLEDWDRQGPKLIETYIKPFIDSDVILGWCLANEPGEHLFQPYLKARDDIQKADPNHPVLFTLRDPNCYALYAPHFAASGISYFKSQSPWELGDLIQAQYPLNNGQQLWTSAPGFVYATNTPKWYSNPAIRLMLNLAFANGSRGWFSFTYHNEPFWAGSNIIRSLTGPFLTFSDLWAELGHRMRRFHGLSTLLLNATPCDDPGLDVKIEYQQHPHSKLPPQRTAIQWRWLKGHNFYLLYIINNDIGEVSPLTLTMPRNLPDHLQTYDMTDFVRNLNWHSMATPRHLEMFPGQGQIILFADRETSIHLRDTMLAGLIKDDQNQISISLNLARRYNLPIQPVQQLLRQIGNNAPLEDIQKTKQAKDDLINIIYQTPQLTQPNSKLIEASAALCGADGALCRLMQKGKLETAMNIGRDLLPLTSQMINLRLQLRKGKGPEITQACNDLAEQTRTMLNQIRNQS